MHHYNSVVSLQITICSDIDGEHNYGALSPRSCPAYFRRSEKNDLAQ